MISLAEKLKQQHGSVIHLYCNSPQEVDYYTKRNSEQLFASVNNSSILLKAAFDTELDPDEVIARARKYEALSGLTINRMAVAHRHFGRGYALGGFHHPRSRYSETVDYLHMVHAFGMTLEYWDREFEEKHITLCLNGTREASYLSQCRDVPYRVMALSRHENYHFWAWNEMYESPLIERAFHARRGGDNIELVIPYFTHRASRATFLKSFSLKAMVKNLALLSARYAYWNLRGYEKAKGYYFGENAKFFFKIRSQYRQLAKLNLKKLADLSGSRFVYFPMHVEPETALHGLSPEYFYQQALIAAVSRDLPAGVFLAVKEAYGAIGRRPDHFYRQIADLKNVVLLDPWEIGIQCAQSADAVVTICGTAGLEALAGGKPVIAFGRHNIYNFHPAVQLVRDETELRNQLEKALGSHFEPESIKRDAKRLLQAIVECSFDMGEYDYLDLTSFENEQVKAAAASLIESLDLNHADLEIAVQ